MSDAQPQSPSWGVDEERYDFTCAITGEIMEDPCSIPCGHTFERKAIVEWLKGHSFCPMSRCELKENPQVVPNINLRNCIQEYQKTRTAKYRFAILFLGNTGVGKSHLVEDLVQQQGLSGDGGESTTTEVKSYYTPNGLLIIDTPGLADTAGRTLKYLDNIVAKVRTRRCLPTIVIQYGEKFTSQFSTCLEAISLCLNLHIHDYILIVNKVTVGGRGHGGPNEVIAQMVEQVTQIIGRKPAKLVAHPMGLAVFEEHMLLPLQPVFTPGAVYTIQELWDRTHTKYQKIEYIIERIKQFMLAEEKFLVVSSIMRNEGWGRFAYGADEFRACVSTAFEQGNYGSFLFGALALPFAEGGTRLLGGGEMFVSLLTTPVEALIDGIAMGWKRPTDNEKQFLAENQRGVVAMYEKLQRVRDFYSVIRTPTA